MQDIARWYRLGNDTNLDKYRIRKTDQNEKNQYEQVTTKSIPSITRNRIPLEELYKNSTNISGEYLQTDEPEYNNNNDEDRNKIATSAPEITKNITESRTETSKEKQYENTISEQKQNVNLELQYPKLVNENTENLIELNQTELSRKKSNPYGYDTLESTGGEKYH